GTETRGIRFVPNADRTNPDQERVFVLQRSPPALVTFNRIGGFNVPADVIEMCSSPITMDMYPPIDPDHPTDDPVRLYVTCFESGQVYVVDPYSTQVVAIIEAGRGPSGLAFAKSGDGRLFAYVVGFGANNVSVVDLNPGVTQYHVVQRIGFPTAVPF